MLLEVDGMNKGWEEGVASTMWEGNLGLHNASNVMDHLPVPVQKMLSPTGLRRYDATSDILDRTPPHVNNAFVLDKQRYSNHQLSRQAQRYKREVAMTVRVLKNLSLSYFQKKLIEYFDIALTKNEVQWPGKRK
jgi:hypothetical protein